MRRIRSFAGLQFDPADGRLASAVGGGEAVSLRPQLARLLLAFLDTPNQVLTREQLAAAVWDDNRIVDFETGLSALIRELRVALGETGADPAMIETVPRRGYRFHLDPDAGPGPVDEPAESGSRPEAAATNGSFPRRVRVAMLALSLAAAALAFWAWTGVLDSDGPDGHTTGSLRMAVLPFVRYRDSVVQPESELRAADAMLAALWQAELERVELIGRTSLIPYVGAANVAERVAQDLGAVLILEGSVSEGDERWRIDVRLLRLPGGSVIWSGMRAHELDRSPDVWTVAEELVAELAKDWTAGTLDRALDDD